MMSEGEYQEAYGAGYEDGRMDAGFAGPRVYCRVWIADDGGVECEYRGTAAQLLVLADELGELECQIREQCDDDEL